MPNKTKFNWLMFLLYLILLLGCPVLLSLTRCRSFCILYVERLSSPHSHDDGIYFACTLAHCCGHSSCCWVSLSLLFRWAGDHRMCDRWPGDGDHSLCWAESSLDWPGMDRAGMSSGQKLNLSTWLTFKARTWGAGECVFIPVSLFLPCLPACGLILIYWNIFFFKSFHRKVLFLITALCCQSEQQVWNTHQVLWTQTH